MGLKITKDSHYGVKANYWRISKIANLDYKGRVCEFLFSGYIGREASKETFQIKDGDKIQIFPIQPITQVGFIIHKKDFDLSVDDNVLKWCYEKIKAVEDWEEAEDVFEENTSGQDNALSGGSGVDDGAVVADGAGTGDSGDVLLGGTEGNI